MVEKFLYYLMLAILIVLFFGAIWYAVKGIISFNPFLFIVGVGLAYIFRKAIINIKGK